MTIKVKQTADGSRNVAVQISGFIRDEDENFEFCRLASVPDRLKLTRLQWAIQEKGGTLLWWDREGKDLVLPLESRNVMTFDSMVVPKGWDGVLWAEGFKLDDAKAFLVIIEFDK